MRERHEGLKDLVILAISAYPCFSGSILESDIPSEYRCCDLVSQLTGSSSRRIINLKQIQNSESCKKHKLE